MEMVHIEPYEATKHHYDYAIEQCRYWWNRHEILPRWRWYARDRALTKSEIWGTIAKHIHARMYDEP